MPHRVNPTAAYAVRWRSAPLKSKLISVAPVAPGTGGAVGGAVDVWPVDVLVVVVLPAGPVVVDGGGGTAGASG